MVLYDFLSEDLPRPTDKVSAGEKRMGLNETIHTKKTEDTHTHTHAHALNHHKKKFLLDT